MSGGIQPKKKNLFKFFKSKDFNNARIKMCAIYILLSYVNELHEDVDRLLKGYDGVLIGMLLHKSKLATKALEDYAKEYEKHIDGTSGQLCDVTIDVTSALDVAIEQNKFFLQEGYKAILGTAKEQVEKTVRDDEQLEKEKFAGFEIYDRESRMETLGETIKRTKALYRDDPNLDKIIEGVKIGFNTACDYTNKIYLES